MSDGNAIENGAADSDGWGLRQPFHDGPPHRLRENAEHGVEYWRRDPSTA